MKKLINTLLILSTMLLISCEKKIIVEEQMGTSILRNLDAKVDNVEVVMWPRGIARKKEVTQGVVVRIKMPQMKKEDGQRLNEKHKINSWVIRLNRENVGRFRPIGYMVVPFFAKTTKRASSYYKIEHVFLEISYAAAYTSSRFRNFDCPAFGHNRKVRNVTISYGNAVTNTITSSYPQEPTFKAEPVGIIPTKFNGGLSVAGRYSVDLALFNNETGSVNGSFITIDGIIEVPLEEMEVLPGCPTYEESMAPGESSDIRQFHFN